MLDSYEIRIRKEALKFAASHMTVFPDGTKEALHGHNYFPTLTLTVRDASFEAMLPFSHFKAGMRKIAQAWDEKVLIASRNPFFRLLRQDTNELEFTLCGKRSDNVRSVSVYIEESPGQGAAYQHVKP